jgi:hypothetical protein
LSEHDLFGKPVSAFPDHAPELFRFSPNREKALSICFHAIPDAKPFHTFAGIALAADYP